MDELITLSEGARLGGVNIPAGAQLRVLGSSLFFNGQKLDLGLSTADVHDPTEMPTYLAGYPSEDFRHEEACPVVLVDKDEDKYRTANENSTFAPVKVKTDDDANPAEVKVETSLTNYRVQPRRLAAFLPDTVIAQAGPAYDVRYVHLQRCKRAIDMDLEADVFGPSGLLTSSGSWRTNWATALALGSQWGGGSGVGASSNPIADMRGRVLKSATRITGWWVNQRVAGYFLDHPKTRDYMRATIGDAPQGPSIRAVVEAGEGVIDFKIPGLGTFHVCCAKWAPPGGGDLDYIMPDVVVAQYLPPGVPTNAENISTCKNFRRRGAAGVGFGVREVRIEQRGAGGVLVIVEEASIPTMTSQIAGGLITGVSQ